MVRSEREASSVSWVTMTKVCPSSSRRRKNRRWSSVRVWVSRLPEGSSARTTCGELMRARATETRCCSPPESSAGLWRVRAWSPRRSSRAWALRSASLRLSPLSQAGMHTFSRAVNSGRRWWPVAESGEAVGRVEGDVFAVVPDFAAIGSVERAEEMQKGAFPRAAGTDDGDDFFFFDRQVDAFQYLEVAITFPDVSDFNHIL